jgi:hypothetical protein
VVQNTLCHFVSFNTKKCFKSRFYSFIILPPHKHTYTIIKQNKSGVLMDILLINTNPVVSRIIALCSKDLDANITIKDSLQEDDLNSFNTIFIDDNLYNEEIANILKSTHLGKRVLLKSKNFELKDDVLFDYVVDKPFLPSKIIEILSQGDEDIVFDIDNIGDDYDTQILDTKELNKIKQILDDETLPPHIEEIDDIEIKKVELIKVQLKSDGVEIINQDEYINNITKNTKKPKKYKKALKKLVENAIEDAIDRYGKDDFKQAVRYQNITIDIQIKE